MDNLLEHKLVKHNYDLQYQIYLLEHSIGSNRLLKVSLQVINLKIKKKYKIYMLLM